MWAVSILARDPSAVSNSQVWRWNMSRPVCFGIAQVEGELSNRKLGVSLRSELSSSGGRKCYYLCLRTPMQLPPPPPPSPTPPTRGRYCLGLGVKTVHAECGDGHIWCGAACFSISIVLCRLQGLGADAWMNKCEGRHNVIGGWDRMRLGLDGMQGECGTSCQLIIWEEIGGGWGVVKCG